MDARLYFNGDGKPDNITFMIKRIKVHNQNALKDPSYRFPGNYGVEKFLELFSDTAFVRRHHVLNVEIRIGPAALFQQLECGIHHIANPSTATKVYMIVNVNAPLLVQIQHWQQLSIMV
uniref:Uncharacterized protein n=1 Tax=Anopheles melas TaxID=34690 RepID=A0A182TU17_9DIPT